MKILFVINSSNNGGAPKMIVTLYNEMKKHYPECKIVFLKKIESQYSNIEGAYYLSNRLQYPTDYVAVYNKLYRLIKDESPEAIISFLPLANIMAGIIGKKLMIKYRIASQRNPPYIYGKVVRYLDKYIGSRNYYTSNVCNSQAGMEAFGQYPKSYKKHLSVINNCVEKPNFSVTVSDAKKNFNIPEDKIILVCVGRLHEQKNHHLLVKTMKYIDNAILYFAGDGPLFDSIKLLIEKEGVRDKIILLGDLDRQNVQLLLRASDIFLIPSIYEGLSNSLIEAMSYGLPIIFSNIPSFTTFLKNEHNNEYAGVLVDNFDEIAWSNSIQNLVDNAEMREHFKKLSFAKVQNLTPEAMTLKFINLVYN